VKRFWTTATVVSSDGRHAIELDGRPVRTPGRALLAVDSFAIANAIAAEWNAVGDTIDARAMPMTGLTNAAIDRVAPDAAGFALGLARYGESDLLCYRADSPAALVNRQQALWDPPLDWARARYDVHFEIVAGIIHTPQPPATLARLGDAIAARSAFELAALSPIVTITGSLVLALALVERAMTPDDVWRASQLDEDWQIEQWGEDDIATRAREDRRTAFDAAADFLALLAS